MVLLRLRFRQRRRIVLMMVVCLLFQQFAMAAYACPLIRMSAHVTAAMTACEAMGMAQQVRQSPPLCIAHCNPTSATTVAAHVSSVPPLALPPLLFARVAVTPQSTILLNAQVPLHRSDPPPMLRFCSLLI